MVARFCYALYAAVLVSLVAGCHGAAEAPREHAAALPSAPTVPTVLTVPTPAADSAAPNAAPVQAEPASGACPDDAARAVRVIDASHCEVDKRVFVGDSSSCLLAMPRLVPVVANGHTIGMRYDSVRSTSVYAQCGIRSGDVWTAINGKPAADPEQMLALASSLPSASKLVIAVLRDGTPRELEIKLR